MKKIKFLSIGAFLFLGGVALGQTRVNAYGTYIPSESITIASPSQPSVTNNGNGTKTLSFTDSKGKASGNTIPNGTPTTRISGGPLFYTGGPQAQLTCGSSGICAEFSNTSYYQYIDLW